MRPDVIGRPRWVLSEVPGMVPTVMANLNRAVTHNHGENSSIAKAELQIRIYEGKEN